MREHQPCIANAHAPILYVLCINSTHTHTYTHTHTHTLHPQAASPEQGQRIRGSSHSSECTRKHICLVGYRRACARQVSEMEAPLSRRARWQDWRLLCTQTRPPFAQTSCRCCGAFVLAVCCEEIHKRLVLRCVRSNHT